MDITHEGDGGADGLHVGLLAEHITRLEAEGLHILLGQGLALEKAIKPLL